MKHTVKNTAKLSGLALAAVAAFTAFGTGAAQAATFKAASITIARQTSEAKETTAGDLNCSFTETGLGPYAQVSYECKAAAVGVVEACVYKNKIISATQLSTFTNVSNLEGEGGGGEGEVFLAKANGTITGSVITAVPEAGEGGGGGEGHLCPELGEVNGPEPTEEVVAIRWCNASLTDVTNNIVGTTVGELFQEFYPGATVPSCAVLLAPPAP